MTNRISNENKFYRRGLVLGFTLAEILLLLLFVLLLILSLFLSFKDKTIEERRHKIENLSQNLDKLNKDNKRLNDDLAKVKKDISALNWIKDKFIKSSGGEADFPDDFTEIMENNRILTGQNAELKREVNVLKESKDALDQIKTNLKNTGLPANTPKEIAQSVKNAVDAQKSIEDAKKDIGASDPKAAIADKNQQIANLQGQTKNLQSQLNQCQGVGKGGSSYPPCWADRETGRPEYVYDVAITDAGFIMRSTNLPHRMAEMKNLPIEAVRLGTEISTDEFLRTTMPLYQYSEKKNCRFYVRLFDKTGAMQKEIYKKHRKIVEGHFYILLMQGDF